MFRFTTSPLPECLREPWQNIPEVNADSSDTPAPMDNTSRSTPSIGVFRLIGCDDSGSESSQENESIENESILASSNHNDTMELPLSAPTSIVRNNILASSTPKEVAKGAGGTPKLGLLHTNTENTATKKEFSEWSTDRRMIYRNGRMRNLAAPMQTPNAPKSSYPKDYINLQAKLEEHRRKEMSIDSHAKESLANIRKENVRVMWENALEFILSVAMVWWHIAYALDVVPTELKSIQALHVAFNVAFAVIFMLPCQVWWFIIASGLAIYLFTAWLFGVTVCVSTFAYVAIVGRALASVLQLLFLAFQ